MARTWGSSSEPDGDGPSTPGAPAGTVSALAMVRSRRRGYCRYDRKSTSCLNFSGGRFLNDGVGLRSVEAIWALGTVLAMWVSTGPGPLFPLSPITWQARQPDSPTTSAPAWKVRFCAWVSVAGGLRSTEFGEPVLAPL